MQEPPGQELLGSLPDMLRRLTRQAELDKETGNRAFAAGDMEAAVGAYTSALQLSNPVRLLALPPRLSSQAVALRTTQPRALCCLRTVQPR